MYDVLIIMVLSIIPILLIVTRFYLKLQEMKLKEGGGNWREGMNALKLENEALKERVKSLEEILLEEERRIDFDYEQEQIRLDSNDNKLEY